MRPIFLVLTLSVLTLATGGCRSSPQEDANAMVLRVYEVPRGSGRQLVSSLQNMLWMGENKLTGRAVVTPDGRVAVLAPANVQTGVQSLVDAVTKNPPTNDPTIELHYFVVLGKPATAPQPPPPGAAEIQPALDEIARTQGPQSFTIEQRARLATLDGEDGKVKQGQGGADWLNVSQKAYQTSEGVYATVALDFANNGKLETRVSLAPDRIVVLGSAGQRSDSVDGATLYYVVRLAPPSGGPKP